MGAMMTKYQLKRIYEEASTDDGYRVLVDRVWPRGISKHQAGLDQWAKEIAPSTELRQWFDHDPAKFSQFKERYKQELDNNSEFADYKSNWQKQSVVTFVYSARDQEHNQAAALKDLV